MRILLLTHAFNSLTQRLFVSLSEKGHEPSVEFDINDGVAGEAVRLFQPDLIVAPFLKRKIPESIWREHVCLIVHPGVPGDRGPSALDWAILHGEMRWGVTVLQANAELDGGDIWASEEFVLPGGAKAGLYRGVVTEAAVTAVGIAVARFEQGGYQPMPLDYGDCNIRGRLHPLMRQSDRAIDWSRDESATAVRRIWSGDGFPGVRDRLLGRDCFLYDAHLERELQGEPGELIARCNGAICRATVDGAVWIGYLRDKSSAHPFKLPATHLLGDEIEHLPEIRADQTSGYRDIWYQERAEVGFLHFSFYNGAMGTTQCRRLLEAYRKACESPTKVIVLMGGPDFWSNGMHLNLIEAAQSPADESWRNINAINDLAREIITTTTHLTVAALQGNAAAGGLFLARAADEVWARESVILNPHYKDMGNLYGSEYWTYLLPRHADENSAKRITEGRLPMGTTEALSLGLIDRAFGKQPAGFVKEIEMRAAELAGEATFPDRLERKNRQRAVHEQEKPLQLYRDHELQKMHLNFYGFDPSYHVARYNFVYKVPKSRTPLTIAGHRRKQD